MQVDDASPHTPYELVVPDDLDDEQREAVQHCLSFQGDWTEDLVTELLSNEVVPRLLLPLGERMDGLLHSSYACDFLHPDGKRIFRRLWIKLCYLKHNYPKETKQLRE